MLVQSNKQIKQELDYHQFLFNELEAFHLKPDELETIENKSNSKTKTVIASIGILAAIVFIASILLHVTPLGLLLYLEDFAIHHYFLMSFISLVVVMLVVLVI